MADFANIEQYDPTTGKTGKKWSYVNTSIEDDNTLMALGFLPLFVLYRNGGLSATQTATFDDISGTFLEDGKFLTLAQYDALNRLLSAYSFNPIRLVNNGLYNQPIIGRNQFPTAKSWLAAGAKRMAHLSVLLNDYNNGNITIVGNVITFLNAPSTVGVLRNQNINRSVSSDHTDAFFDTK